MKSLRGRFILSHLLPMLLVIPLVGMALLYLLETQVLLASLQEDITRQAKLVAELANNTPGIWGDSSKAQVFVSQLQTFTSGQITLLQPTGKMLATSDPNQEEETGGLPAVPPVGDGRNVQVVTGLLRQTAVVFVPVVNADEQIVGFVRMTDQIAGISSRFRGVRSLVLGAVGLELLLGVVLGLFLAIRLERPISKVTVAVHDIASGQRVDPIAEGGAREIRLLIEAVNSLAERLRLLEETRRRLLANLVHELGRPLGALRAASHALITGADAEPAMRYELLQGMETEIARLQPLLDDLAQLHGQVLGTRELNCRQTALSGWLSMLLLPWREAAREKELGWETTIPDDLPQLSIDPERLAQAVGNLVSNAVKYTRSGGKVVVAAGSDERSVWIRVSDSGAGISDEEQLRVFDPFYRGQQNHRFPQGMGLGLTIARDLVTAHSGQLTVSSSEGQGSQFTILLPRPQPDRATEGDAGKGKESSAVAAQNHH